MQQSLFWLVSRNYAIHSLYVTIYIRIANELFHVGRMTFTACHKSFQKPNRHFSWVLIWLFGFHGPVSQSNYCRVFLSMFSYSSVLLDLDCIKYQLSFPYLPNLPSSFNSLHQWDTYQLTPKVMHSIEEKVSCGRLVALEFSHLPTQSKIHHVQMFGRKQLVCGRSSAVARILKPVFIWLSWLGKTAKSLFIFIFFSFSLGLTTQESVIIASYSNTTILYGSAWE